LDKCQPVNPIPLGPAAPCSAGRSIYGGRNTMRKLVSSALFTTAAAAAAIALSASAAFAASFTVSNPNADGSFSSSLHSGATVVFNDVNTNQTFTCSVSSVSGHAPSGTSADGSGIASLENGSFTSCTGPLSSTGNARLTAGTLNAVSFASGVTSGNITGISASLVINSIIGTCNATVSGQVNSVTYNNNGTLTVSPDTANPQLTINTATGSCAGLINAGDKTTFSAQYDVSPVLTVTSP
jgi:hypothetical protein